MLKYFIDEKQAKNLLMSIVLRLVFGLGFY